MLRYRTFRFAGWVMTHLPRRAAYLLAALLGELAFAANPPARRVAISNMRHVLGPDAPKHQIISSVRGCFRAAVNYYTDLARTPLMDPVRFSEHNLRDYGYGYLTEAAASGRGAVLATLHYGNPEFVSQCLSARGLRFLALVEPLEPPELHELFQRHRRSQGHEFVEVGMSGIKQAIRHLRKGGIVAVLVDRDIQHSGVDTPFFGSMARLPVGAVDLALHTGADLLPAITRRIRLDEFEATIEPPLKLLRTGNRDEDRRINTARLIKRFEKHLRQDPSQWFVLEEPVWPARSVPAARVAGAEPEHDEMEESAG
jgi:phosphatidylinositol dimannoside acyltransferase